MYKSIDGGELFDLILLLIFIFVFCGKGKGGKGGKKGEDCF